MKSDFESEDECVADMDNDLKDEEFPLLVRRSRFRRRKKEHFLRKGKQLLIAYNSREARRLEATALLLLLLLLLQYRVE